MKAVCFSLDDNIRVLKEITQWNLESIFDHPYMAMLRRLHEKFNLKIQMNLFYRMHGFDLSQMSDRYKNEWASVADWLKLSFHSELDNAFPYKDAGYDEVFRDCHAIHEQILRFASHASLAQTATVHYCQTTPEGVRALADNGVKGLLGLFGSLQGPMTSYSLGEEVASEVRKGKIVSVDGMAFAPLDMVVNSYEMQYVVPVLTGLLSQQSIRLMIHEQYFYEDWDVYQADFEEKLMVAFEFLYSQGYESCFFEELI